MQNCLLHDDITPNIHRMQKLQAELQSNDFEADLRMQTFLLQIQDPHPTKFDPQENWEALECMCSILLRYQKQSQICSFVDRANTSDNPDRQLLSHLESAALEAHPSNGYKVAEERHHFRV